MDRGLLKSFSFAVFCGVYAFNAAVGASLFSNQGQIQNVQNYSTNPFWSPGSPYNQKTPQPVYVQGTDIKSGDCIAVVQPLISIECMARENCKNTSLSDIRPSIMVQLSNLPNKNYVSACAGYIDSVFESYVAQYGNSVSNSGYTSFPAATTPSNYSDNTVQMKNPYKVEPAKWTREVNERRNELQQLQEQNGSGIEQLTEADFPSVYEDLSFSARMELQAEGYEPFKDMDSYIVPEFKNDSEWCNGNGKFTDFCKEREEKITKKQEEQPKKEEKPKQAASQLCPKNIMYNLATDNRLVNIYAKNENIARRLTEELIKCSTEQELVVPISNSVFKDCDRKKNYCVYAVDADTKTTKHKILFKSINSTSNEGDTFDIFAGLCAIAGGIAESKTSSDSAQTIGGGSVGWALSVITPWTSARVNHRYEISCPIITKAQCTALNTLFQELSGKSENISFDSSCKLTIVSTTENNIW